MYKKKCIGCNIIFEKQCNISLKTWNNRTKYCSKDCWSKTHRHSIQTKKKLSEISKGQRRSPSTEFKKDQKAHNKGLKLEDQYTKEKAKEIKKKMSLAKKGNKHPFWKGGKSWTYLHLNARKAVEKYIGRKLKKSEIIHHIDENPENNDLSNLMITNKREHYWLHQGKIEPKSVKTMREDKNA